jgi:predicted branched-subunit amino acid permease
MQTTPFTVSGMRRGLIAAQPLSFGVFIYGIAFGLIASEANLSVLEALLMSGVVYSGSAQLVAVNSLMGGNIPAGGAFLTVLATILLLNGRYILYGAAMRPWLGGLPAYQAYPTLAVLGDGNWILSMKASSEGEQDAGFVFASGFGMFIPWVGGTWIGSTAISFVSNPSVLGLDFMLIAFSAAMAMSMFKGRSDLRVIGVAVIVSLLVNQVAPGGAAIMAAGISAGLMTWITFDEAPEP